MIIMKNNLISLTDAFELPRKDVKKYYSKYLNKGIPKYLNILGFDNYEVLYSDGCYVYTKCGRKILDFTAGQSVLNLGHNNPRILAAKKKYCDAKYTDICKAFMSPVAAALAKNLADLCPGDLKLSFFCNSGAEAVEGALKLAEKYHYPDRTKIIYTDISYHGKTHAALSVSGCEASKIYFKQLPDCQCVKYGDFDEFAKLVETDVRENHGKCGISAFILEAIHAEGVILPPADYLPAVRRLCDKYEIILIIDEVFCGFGRTGKMFAFEHFNIIPDVITVSKGMSGGKATIGAYITTDKIYDKVYGKLNESMMHTTTYGGFGEECAVAIEALNIIVDENIPERANRLGCLLSEKLKKLENKYPDLIKETRSIGLLGAVEFKPLQNKIIELLRKNKSVDNLFDGIITGFIVSQLLEQFNILTFAGQHQMNCLFINPPLIAAESDIDYFIESLDKLLAGGIVNLVTKYIEMRVKRKISIIF